MKVFFRRVVSFPFLPFCLLACLLCALLSFRLSSDLAEAASAFQQTSTPGSVIYRSDDRGETWTAVGALPDVRVMVGDPVTSSVLYAGSSAGFYKSVNGGATWTPVGQGAPRNPVTAIAVDPRNTAVLYVAIQTSDLNGALYKSVDAGENWSKSDEGLGYDAEGLTINTLRVSSSNSNTILVGSRAGIYSSQNGGATWSLVKTQLTYTAHGGVNPYVITAIEGDPSSPETLYASSYAYPPVGILYGLQKSTDSGASWTGRRLEGIVNGYFDAFAISQSNPLIMFGRFKNNFTTGIVKTIDGGVNWGAVFPETRIAAADRARLAIDPTSPTVVYGAIDNAEAASGELKNGFYKTVDGGENWVRKTIGGPESGVTAIVVDAQNPSRLFVASASALSNRSAASYSIGLATESIAAMFGSGLATTTERAGSTPLPYALANASVIVRDSKGQELPAPLFFASPNQVNYQIPQGLSEGQGVVKLLRGQETIAADIIQIYSVSPGLFSADASGTGIPAGVAFRIRADGSQGYEPIFRYDPAVNRVVALPIDLGVETDQVYLILFGTGFRNDPKPTNYRVELGGIDAPAIFAGPAPGFVGVDQLNVFLPRTLAGKGEIELSMRRSGDSPANPLRITIQ